MEPWMQFVVWLYGITWAGVIFGILVSGKREEGV